MKITNMGIKRGQVHRFVARNGRKVDVWIDQNGKLRTNVDRFILFTTVLGGLLGGFLGGMALTLIGLFL